MISSNKLKRMISKDLPRIVEGTPGLLGAMPGYRKQEEFEALLSPSLRSRIAELGIRLVSYTDFAMALTKT